MTGQAMEISFIAMLNIGKATIPFVWILGFAHAQYMNHHLINDLCIAMILGVEGSRFGDLGVQQ
jgi:hypothetical protein